MKNALQFIILSTFWTYSYSSCTTPLGLSSECVSINSCPDIYNALKRKQLSSKTVTFLRQSHCGFEERSPKVCCGPVPNESPPTTTQVPQTPSSSHKYIANDAESANTACTTPLGQSSECMSIYNCPSIYRAFELKPIPSSIVSFLRQSQCGFQDYIPLVCCGPLPKATTSPPATASPTPSLTLPPVTQLVPREPPQSDSDDDSVPSPAGQCGIDASSDRIYGGQITDLDEFPWAALLGYRKRDKSITYQCGGVLINRRYVLTAAHCITGAIKTAVGELETVRLGEYDTQSEIDCLDNDCADPPQEIPVQAAAAHPGFSERNKNRQDDIGIVRLARRAAYTDFVRPVCLVEATARLAADSGAYVVGWGKTLMGSSSSIKLKLGLPIYNHEKCKDKYKPLGVALTDRQICAGGVHAQDACRGDSGGPLMRRRDNAAWEVIGIVSFGYGCGKEDWPGVYTSVPAYNEWITSMMQSMNV